MHTPLRTRQLYLYGTSVALGLLYGLIVYSGFASISLLMGVSFVFVVPFGIGVMALWLFPTPNDISYGRAFLLPILPLLLFLGITLLLNLEGIICIVLLLPAGIVTSGIGGVITLAVRQNKQNSQHYVLASLAVLPLLSGAIEYVSGSAPRSIRTVPSSIIIHAPVETVWQNIIRVPLIRPEEQQTSFFHAIGFPRPLEATLSHEGVGGVRHATFEGHVLFLETITAWQPQRHIAFTIAAQTDSIPATTFDQHVTVGGPYFDVLTGEYTIEQRNDSTIVLHLSSDHRLSTTMNLYAGWWTEAIMQDIQSTILAVIKKRCEATSHRVELQ